MSDIEETFIEPEKKGKPAESSEVIRQQLPNREQGSAGFDVAQPSDSIPTLVGVVERYNIVSYEGWIYAVPQELGPLDLSEVDIMEMEGVIRDVSIYAVEAEIVAKSN